MHRLSLQLQLTRSRKFLVAISSTKPRRGKPGTGQSHTRQSGIPKKPGPDIAKRDVIVIGASAGGVETLGRLVEDLPANLPAAILVVMHFPETSTSVLPAILSRRGALRAHHAEDGERISNGHIHIAAPGRHMLLFDSHICLTASARENGNRPAIDPLFRSAARAKGPCVVSLLLSGLLDDGTLGSAAVKNRGGVTIAQDPDDALFGDMPRNAIEQVGIHHVLPLDQIGKKLIELAGEPVKQCKPADSDAKDPSYMNLGELQQLEHLGQPSHYVCPECQGTLFELAEEGVRYYRCRVGHSYLEESLATSQATAVEMALWSALRAVKEHNSLLVKMLERAEVRGFKLTARSYHARLAEGQRRLLLIEQVLDLPRDERLAAAKETLAAVRATG